MLWLCNLCGLPSLASSLAILALFKEPQAGPRDAFKALSAAVYGIDAHIIDVEVDFSGIQVAEDRFSTVGLPDAAVRESRDRVRAAIRNSGSHCRPRISRSIWRRPT